MQTNIKQDIIDASGLACPLPLLKVKQWLAHAEAGTRLKIIATDQGTARDVPRYLAANKQHRLLSESLSEHGWTGIIEAGKDPTC